MQRRVVITGIGVVSPIGTGRDRFWSALKQGVSGVDKISFFDASDFPSQIAAEVRDFDPLEFVEKREARRLDRFTQFAIGAAHLAVDDAALDTDSVDPERFGVLIGSGIGGIGTLENQYKVLIEKGPGRVSPFFVPMLIANMAGGHVGIRFGARGPNQTVVTACATATNAIGEAFKLIQHGRADMVLAGGTEAPITPLSVAGFSAMRALSTRNDDPAHASRPFDRERDGFVLGEGAGVLVLESVEHAESRGAVPLAEVAGFATNSDAYHITQPSPGGVGPAKCMELAIVDAGITVNDVDYINAHGTSTPLNDRTETAAIKRAFGEVAYNIPVSSTKSMHGHLLGATGAVEAAAVLLAVVEGVIPPTINYEHPDPDCDLDYVPNRVRKQQVTYALSNSFGFGGHNACLVFKAWQEGDR